jgi:micrococcal nuclease
MYQYYATVISVHDGDTLTVDIDLGFGVLLRNQKIRLHGINAPEINSDQKDEAIAVRDWLRTNLVGKQIDLMTMKDKKEKFGRYLGMIVCDGVYINDKLLSLFPCVQIYPEKKTSK